MLKSPNSYYGVAFLNNMSKFQPLREFVRQRLTAAAEEIFDLFEKTIAEFEEELCQRGKHLAPVQSPEQQTSADLQQLLVSKEEEEQQECSPGLEPPELPHNKEEHEELWACVVGEHHQEPEEADITDPSVRRKDGDEEKLQSPQLHQRHTEEIQMKLAAEDCEGSEPAGSIDPDGLSQSDTTSDEMSDFSGNETDDSSDWEDIRKPAITRYTLGSAKSDDDSKEEPQPSQLHQTQAEDHRDTDHVKTWHLSEPQPDQVETEEPQDNEEPVSEMECDSGESGASFSHDRDPQKHNRIQPAVKSFTCSVCGVRYRWKASLEAHMRLHSEGKKFSCSVCKKTFQFRVQVVKHMRVHWKEKAFSCSVCGFVRRSTSFLTVHSRVYPREKPFSCPICETSVSDKSNVSKPHQEEIITV